MIFLFTRVAQAVLLSKLGEVLLFGDEALVEARFVGKSTLQVWPDTLQRGEFRRVLPIPPLRLLRLLAAKNFSFPICAHLRPSASIWRHLRSKNPVPRL